MPHKFNGWTGWNNDDAKHSLPKSVLSMAAYNPGKIIVLGAGNRDNGTNIDLML